MGFGKSRFKGMIVQELMIPFYYCCFKAKIAFLEGEKRGFELLKADMLRRIKMLEYSLKKERYWP